MSKEGTALQPATVSALFELLGAISAPCHQAGVGRVLRIVERAWSLALDGFEHVDLLHKPMPSLSAAVDESADVDPIESRVLLLGHRKRHPAWCDLATLALDTEKEPLRLIGRELMLSILQRRSIRPNVIRLAINPAASKSQEGRDRLRRYTERITDDLHLLTHSFEPKGPVQLLRSRILAAYWAQTESKNVEDRKHAGSSRQVSLGELRSACALLRMSAERGDPLALSVVLAICAGPTLDIALDIPFVVAPENLPASINLVDGIVQISLDGLKRLARWQIGNELATPRIEVALPSFAADALRSTVASNPNAKSLRGLLKEPNVSGRTRQPSGEGRATSIGRLVRSRARPLLDAGADRATAAYACGDLSLLGPCAHHYLTLSPIDLYRANVTRYASLGWGQPVQPPTECGYAVRAVGSRATPTQSTVRYVDSAFVRHVTDTRAGRRYSWASVVAAHNAYALLCAHRVAFFTAARASRALNFSAADFHHQLGLVGLADKRTSESLAIQGLPIPARLGEQIRLWRLHLGALRRRANKLDLPQARSAIQRIDAIFGAADVREFFRIDYDGSVTDIGSRDLARVHADVPLKSDWRRHFVCTSLARAGVPLRLVEGHLRHTVRGNDQHASTSCLPTAAAHSHVAVALDQVALDVGMCLVGGLVNG